jgi:hypothetical protein
MAATCSSNVAGGPSTAGGVFSAARYRLSRLLRGQGLLGGEM